MSNAQVPALAHCMPPWRGTFDSAGWGTPPAHIRPPNAAAGPPPAAVSGRPRSGAVQRWRLPALAWRTSHVVESSPGMGPPVLDAPPYRGPLGPGALGGVALQRNQLAGREERGVVDAR